MKYLAAFLLLGLGGNASPSAADVKAVLESVGIEADSERLDTLISELEGKDINEVRHRLPRHWKYIQFADMLRRSSSLRALPSLPPSRRAVPVAVPLLVALLLPAALLLRRPRRRPRRRVRISATAPSFSPH
jgi:hypothetical protein